MPKIRPARVSSNLAPLKKRSGILKPPPSRHHRAISPVRLAELLGCTRRNIYYAMRDGRLPSVLIDGVARGVPEEFVPDLLKNPPFKRFRPRQRASNASKEKVVT
jgi:hypothetical protein